MQILALNMYNFGTWLEICRITVYDVKKRSGTTMKKTWNTLRRKLSVVSVMNWCALIAAAYSINVACVAIHHQPEVPEEAKMLRKF